MPFVLTAAANTKDGEAVPAGNKMKKWVEKELGKGAVQESRDVRYEAYLALVEGRVRKAWVSAIQQILGCVKRCGIRADADGCLAALSTLPYTAEFRPRPPVIRLPLL